MRVVPFSKGVIEASYKLMCREWRLVSSLLLETHTEVERVLDGIDPWQRDQMVLQKGLHNMAIGWLTNNKRGGDDDAKRSGMMALLSQWKVCEEAACDWSKRTLSVAS